jgi:hypothetical protein
MKNNSQQEVTQRSEGFAEQAQGPSQGVVRELLGYLKTHKKWWMIPIIVMLLLFGALVVLSSTAAAPFIYTLF